MTKLLVQNSKMKKASQLVYNFGMPALESNTGLKTCPNAGKCAIGCFAKSGAYLFSNVAKAYETRLQVALSDDFSSLIQTELNAIIKRNKNNAPLFIRIHDSADFFDETYYNKWLVIMLNNPNVNFYAYTKMISFFKARKIPSNFTVIFSYGGKEDHLIDPINDRHSLVFENAIDLVNANYVNASHDDMLAIGKNKRIGLIYHGQKKYQKTSWNKVEQLKKVG